MMSALILAAGQSKRYGKNKLLLPVGGNSVIGRVVESFLASDLSEVILVLGFESNLVKGRITNYPRLKIVENSGYHKGMATSIKAALPYLNFKTEAIMVALGDQPLISGDLINHIISVYDQCGKKILAPHYQGRRGHPVIVDLSFREEIEELEGDVGLREILNRHPDDVFAYHTNDPSVIFDVDTPEDYQRLFI